jgi:Putative tRNA binding domain
VQIASHARQFGQALRETMGLADRVKKYVDTHQPWELAKKAGTEDLVDKLTVMVAKLAPRTMEFGVTEGMVLAAGHADEKAKPGIVVLEPFPGELPGKGVC